MTASVAILVTAMIAEPASDVCSVTRAAAASSGTTRVAFGAPLVLSGTGSLLGAGALFASDSTGTAALGLAVVGAVMTIVGGGLLKDGSGLIRQSVTHECLAAQASATQTPAPPIE